MADEQATANGRERTARKPSGSPWSPFRHSTFTVLWTATVVANIGIWMYNAGSGWLMTSLNADPFVVSLVQAATSLPVFLLAVPAKETPTLRLAFQLQTVQVFSPKKFCDHCDGCGRH